MLNTNEDGEYLCPSCGMVLSGAHLVNDSDSVVVYVHSDYAARKFTEPCHVDAGSFQQALRALNDFPKDWAVAGR